MRALAILAIVAVLGTIVAVLKVRRRREEERMARVRYANQFLQKATEDPATCEHQWLEYGHGVCISDYEGWGSQSVPRESETYTTYMCPKCHAKSFTCTGRSTYHRTLTGWDACMGCYCMPDCPAELHAEQPKAWRDRGCDT